MPTPTFDSHQKPPESSAVLSLITRWEIAHEQGVHLPLNVVCEQQMHLLDDVRDGLVKLGYDPDYTPVASTTKQDGFTHSTLEYSEQPQKNETEHKKNQQPVMVGAYRIVRVLGEGGMGTVFLAEDPTLRRQVAMKMMKPSLAQMPLAKDRFLREARMAASLSHDNILPILHVGEHDKQPYLVMPLLVGETLEARLKRGPLNLKEWMQLGIETCQGLVCAHGRQMIHRDIKPSNIWLETMSETSWRVKLLDFGLARTMSGSDNMTMSGALMGTPAYMSPEQVNQQPLDQRSDLFSLGAVLYEALSGISPFKREMLTAVFRAVVEHEPPVLRQASHAPEAISDIVRRMIAKDAARRPESASQVLEELLQINKERFQQPVEPEEKSARVSLAWQPWLVSGIAVVLLAAAFWILRSPATPSVDQAQGTKVATRTDQAFKGTIDFRVRRTGADGKELFVPLNDPRALPLYVGDYFVINASIEPAMYVYLFWIDTQGKVDPVYPWTPGKWGTRTPPERPVNGRLSIHTETNNEFKIAGDDSGLESLILLAKHGSPLNYDDDAFKQLFKDLPPQPLQPGRPRARLWFEKFKLITHDEQRGPDWSGEPTNTSINRLQKSLEEKLGKEVDYSLSMSFTKLGKKRE